MSAAPSLARLDLNLLVSLDALLRERSVTRAAERLMLSQPALSAALARLRSHFKDPILARRGNSYELTPLALRLSERVPAALEMTRRVFDSQTEWSPATSSREFSVFGSDYSFATTGQRVSRHVMEAAPDVRFHFLLHTTSIVDQVSDHLRTVDGILLPHGHISDLPHLELWTDRWVILASDDNPIADDLSLDALARAPWVFTYQSRTAFTSASQQLRSLGLEPRVEAIVETFLSLPPFVQGTPRLGLLQEQAANLVGHMPGVRVLPTPFEASPIVNALWWHPVHEHDPEHIWMREQFRESTRDLRDRP